MLLDASLRDFDPDRIPSPAIALRVETTRNDNETPAHRHRKGWLVLALRGGFRTDGGPPLSGRSGKTGQQGVERVMFGAVLPVLAQARP